MGEVHGQWTMDHGQVIMISSEIREFLDRKPLTPAEVEAATPAPPVAAADDPEEADVDAEEDSEKLEAAIEGMLRKNGGSLTLQVTGGH